MAWTCLNAGSVDGSFILVKSQLNRKQAKLKPVNEANRLTFPDRFNRIDWAHSRAIPALHQIDGRRRHRTLLKGGIHVSTDEEKSRQTS
jgi:hypothetical protein